MQTTKSAAALAAAVVADSAGETAAVAAVAAVEEAVLAQTVAASAAAAAAVAAFDTPVLADARRQAKTAQEQVKFAVLHSTKTKTNAAVAHAVVVAAAGIAADMAVETRTRQTAARDSPAASVAGCADAAAVIAVAAVVGDAAAEPTARAMDFAQPNNHCQQAQGHSQQTTRETRANLIALQKRARAMNRVRWLQAAARESFSQADAVVSTSLNGQKQAKRFDCSTTADSAGFADTATVRDSAVVAAAVADCCSQTPQTLNE